MSHFAVKTISSHAPISGISSAEAPAKGGVLEIAGKVARAVVVALIALVGNILTLGIPLACRLVADDHQTEIKEEIEKRQLEHLFKLELKFYSVEGVPENFEKKVLCLQKALSDLKEKVGRGERIKIGTVEKLYGQFQAFASSKPFIETYQDLKRNDHPLAQFLNDLAERFYSAPVDDLLIKHAKEKFGGLRIDGSIGQIGEVLKARQEEFCFRRDSTISKLFWAITHPKEMYHSWESQERPDLYNSRESNPMYVVQELDFSGRKIQLVAGPTPYNDPVYRHIFLKGAHELRFNIMDRSKKHEKPMIEKMEEIAGQSDGHLNHVLFGFVTKEKRGYLNHTDLNTLVDQYQKVLLQSRTPGSDSGVFLPSNLTDDEIKEVCQKAKQLQTDLTKKEARHAVIVAIDTMLALKILEKHIEKVPEDSPVYVATACKQCFDRGPVYLAALMLFLRNQKEPLSEDEFYRIAGLPLFRSPLNEGREQLRKKFAVFYELTQMLGSFYFTPFSSL